MGYWVVGHMRTMTSSVMYKSQFRMGDMTRRRVFMITCEMLFNVHFRSTKIISLLFSGRGRFDGIGNAI